MQDMVMKLDDLGKPAWLALMIAGFIVFWPLGLAVLAFLIWSGRMTCGWREGGRGRWQQRLADGFERGRDRVAREAMGFATGMAPSGNKAFDEYRSETLRRLEEESRDFQDFLERLRLAKDRSEFDQFMDERRTKPAPRGDGEGSVPKAG